MLCLQSAASALDYKYGWKAKVLDYSRESSLSIKGLSQMWTEDLQWRRLNTTRRVASVDRQKIVGGV